MNLEFTKSILDYIKSPSDVDSLTKFEELIYNKERLTLIERSFYDKFIVFLIDNDISKVQGDVVNVGIFRGGFSLFLKAFFSDLHITCHFWLFDSFIGFENLNPDSKLEKESLLWFNSYLEKIKFPSHQSVSELFEKFNMTESLSIIEGDIEETYRHFDGDSISILHIDVDFYSPTYNSLKFFYDLVSIGGIIVIDDYYLEQTNCKEAVDSFRIEKNIQSPLIKLGNYQVGWVKS
jgi:O-methyltransferase